jgi:DNA-binding MurR/RpiR family transcriptional regulator
MTRPARHTWVKRSGRGGATSVSDHTKPTTYDELVAVLQDRLPRLTPSQRLLAERVMADPEGVAFMTVGELASAVDVNESTVVRFAASLGLDGYPGLTRLCRERLREQAQLLRRFSDLERLGRSTEGEDLLERAAAFDQANIARTLARVDRQSWAATVEALAEAPRVHVLGLRKCFSVAYLLGYLLGMVRDDVATLQGGAGTLVEELRRVRSGDCFVGISIHRYSRMTVRGFQRAQRVGATTIALTDNPSSPLTRDADHVFYVDTTGVAVLRSVTAFVSLAQALANDVAATRGARTRSALTTEEELLDELDVYEERP